MDSLPLPRIGGFSGVLDFAIWLLGRFEFPITIFTLIRIWINGQRNKVYIPNKRHIENYPSVIYATPSHALVRGTFRVATVGVTPPRKEGGSITVSPGGTAAQPTAVEPR